MHIEINAGGLSAEIAVAEYQLNMSGFISDAENIISSFKAVAGKTHNLSGGVGALQSAVDDVSARIQQEEHKLEAIKAVRVKSNDFLNLAIRVDKQVASLVNQNKNEFYKTNPWLKPTVGVDDTPWYEDVWNWLCDKGEQISDGAKKAWTWIKDTAKKAWDGLVEFYNENKRLCQILIGVAAIAIAVVVTVATGGAALPALLAMTKTALVGALTSAAIGGTLTAVTSLISGESLEDSLSAAFESAIDGFCSGFMWGGIFAAGSQIVSVVKTAGSGASGLSSASSTKPQYESLNDIPESEYQCISKYNTDSAAFNDPIRHGKTTSDTRLLDKMINERELSTGKTLFRRGDLVELNGLDVSDLSSLNGKTYSFKGFMSTSPDPKLPNYVSGGKVFFEFSAPAGTKALDLSALMYNEVILSNPVCRIDQVQKLTSGAIKIIGSIL